MYINNPDLYPLQLKLFQMVQNNMVSELTQMEGANRTPLTPESLKVPPLSLQQYRSLPYIHGCRNILSAV